MKKVVSIVISAFILVVSFQYEILNVNASLYKSSEEYIYEFINEMSIQNENYLMDGISIDRVCSMYDSNGNSNVFELYKIHKNSEMKAYIILRTVDKVVVESSLTNNMPFEYEVDKEYVYNYFDCGYIQDDGNIVYNYTNEETQISTAAANVNNYNFRTILPNTTIYLQGNRNCIICAMAHALVYFNNNGYSGVCDVYNQYSFNSLMDSLASIMNSMGGYANNNIRPTFSRYALDTNYTIISNGTWNPDYSFVKNSISFNCPVLLGYAAGSDSYSTTVGHMTLCVGAASSVVENDYVELIDGHQSNLVYRLWNSNINDYASTLSIYNR